MNTPKKKKKIEENNKIGKTRDLFKKIKDTKGLFHEKMGTIKYRNNMDLTEVDEKVARIYRSTIQKEVLMTWITRMMWSLT